MVVMNMVMAKMIIIKRRKWYILGYTQRILTSQYILEKASASNNILTIDTNDKMVVRNQNSYYTHRKYNSVVLNK